MLLAVESAKNITQSNKGHKCFGMGLPLSLLFDNAIIYDFITADEFTRKLCRSQKSQLIPRGPNGLKFEDVICERDSCDDSLYGIDCQCEQEYMYVQVPEDAVFKKTVQIRSGCSAWVEDIDNQIEKLKLCSVSTSLFRPRIPFIGNLTIETSECDTTGLFAATIDLRGLDHVCQQDYITFEFAGERTNIPSGCSCYIRP